MAWREEMREWDTQVRGRKRDIKMWEFQKAGNTQQSDRNKHVKLFKETCLAERVFLDRYQGATVLYINVCVEDGKGGFQTGFNFLHSRA